MSREGFRDDAALARLGAIALCRATSDPGLRRAGAAAAFLLAITAANLVGNVRFAASAAGAGCSLPEQVGIVPPAGDLPMKEFDVRRWTMTAAATATVSLASASHATDRLVPQQYPTIQAAVNASVNGDRVLISPGFYRESVKFLGKSVMLEGLSPESARETIVSGFGVVGPAIEVAEYTDYVGEVGIRFLTVTNDSLLETDQNSGALFSYLGPNAIVVVDRCIFRGNYGDSAYGALYIGHTASRITGCLFHENFLGPGAIGTAIFYWGGPVAGDSLVERCVIRDHAQGGAGVIAMAAGTRTDIRDCVVKSVPTLLQNYGPSSNVSMTRMTGCSIGSLILPGFSGYVDGGGNDWDGPCPDCDANGVIDLEEILFGGADCNGNGVVDACDLAANPKLDRNDDGVIDACQCIPDITGNGLVDGVDLAAVLSAWGTSGDGEFNCDVSGDGVVSGPDLSIVLGGWGPCP